MPKIIPINNIENTKNKVTSIDASSTDTQYPSAKAVYDSLSNFSGGSVEGAVVYNDSQELTEDEQKTARQNIGALAANAVVNSLVTSDNQFLPYNVPNGIAINDFATKYLIRCDVEQSELTPEEKAQARENINAASVYLGSGDMPEGYDFQIDLSGETNIVTNAITEYTNNELPTCEAVKNYISFILDNLDSKLQELL